jgi:hypothetical protein
MICASVAFAGIAFVTGLTAAWRWFQASGVKIGSLGPDWALPGTGGHIEPVDEAAKALDLAVTQINDGQAILAAFTEASRLNKTAALWTAGSVAATAVSAMLAVVASTC